MTSGQALPALRVAQLWLGRAGAGKTHGCLAEIAEELKKAPRGGPLILLAPEQSTAQLERRLAGWPGLPGGYTRARVISFRRLAYEALRAAGEKDQGDRGETETAERAAPSQSTGSTSSAPSTLGEMGRAMLLAQTMSQLNASPATTLKVFNTRPAPASLAAKLGGTLDEFARYGWDANALEEAAGRLALEDGGLTASTRKLSDLTALWRGYAAALARGGMEDAAAHALRAERSVAAWDELDGARIWVDGFSTFTEAEMRLLLALLGHSSQAVIALCADPAPLLDEARGRRPKRRRAGTERLFDPLAETWRLLRERLAETGWNIETVALPGVNAPTRFAESPALAHLEAAALDRLAPAEYEDAAGQFNSAAPPIELIEAADRRAEIEAVARRIVAACRRPAPGERLLPGPAATWREIAVMTRSLERYAPLVREVFAQWDIPFFLDAPRETVSQPLARLIVAALQTLQTGWGGREALAWLKTGLVAGIAPAERARLENHIAARSGAAWRRQGGASGKIAAGALEAFEAAAAPLGELDKRLRSGENPGRALWTMLEGCGAPVTMAGWIEQARADGDEETAQLHERAWERTIEWIEELEALAAADPEAWSPAPDEGETNETAYGAFLEMLADAAAGALGACRARLVPPTLNQVTVGAIDRSRTPEVAVTFVLGMNEGEWPRVWKSDPVLGDRERERLAGGRASGGARLGPGSSTRALTEHYLAYIAMTRPSRRLILTRPLLDEEGKAADASPYFKRVHQVFPMAPLRRAGRSGEGEAPSLPVRPEEWTLGLGRAWEDWLQGAPPARLAGAMRHGHPLDWPATGPGARARLEVAARARALPVPARLDPALARRFWAMRPAASVTQMENYRKCPFMFFAQTMLRIKERELAAPDARQRGSFMHKALEKVFENCKTEGRLDWAALDPLSAAVAIDEARRVFAGRAEWPGDAIAAVALERWAKDLDWIVRGMTEAARRGAFEQSGAEYKFGDEEKGGRFSVEIDGLAFELEGVIDRVDRLREPPPGAPPVFVVVDYKNSGRRLDMGDLAEGVELQLGAYAVALRERLRKDGRDDPQLAALYYWPLTNKPIEAEAGGLDEQARLERWFDQNRPAGIFEAPRAAQLDSTIEPQQKSAVYGFKLNKDGSLSKQGAKGFPEGALAELVRFEAETAGAILREACGGCIGVEPYEKTRKITACSFCRLEGVCRRTEPGVAEPRRPDPARLGELMERLGMEQKKKSGKS